MIRNYRVEQALDFAASGVFAAALAFSAATLASGLIAAVVGPTGFALAYVVLARADRRGHALKAFDLEPIALHRREPAEHEGQNVVELFRPALLTRVPPTMASVDRPEHDATKALSDALAQLKQSLR